MAAPRVLAQQAAARDAFANRIAEMIAPSFIEQRIAPLVSGGASSSWQADVVQNDGTGPATVSLRNGATALFAKFYLDDSGAHCHQVLSALWSDGFGANGRYRVAEPLGFFPELNMLLLRGAPGAPGAEAQAADELNAVAREGARWLVQLHTSPVRLGPPRYRHEVYHKLLHRLAKAAAQCPDRVDDMLAATDRLEARVRHLPLRFTQSHGQYRHIHLFMDDEQVTVIDLDRCRPGDPAGDVGEFLHRMRTKRFKASGGADRADEATAAFLDEYRAALPKHLEALPFYWGYHVLVSRWRLMKSGDPDDARREALDAYYDQEFERALESDHA